MTEKFTPTTETVFECFLDGAEGSFIREDLERYLAGVRAAALEEAAQIAERQQYADGLTHPDQFTEDIERLADARARAIAAGIRAAKEQP